MQLTLCLAFSFRNISLFSTLDVRLGKASFSGVTLSTSVSKCWLKEHKFWGRKLDFSVLVSASKCSELEVAGLWPGTTEQIGSFTFALTAASLPILAIRVTFSLPTLICRRWSAVRAKFLGTTVAHQGCYAPVPSWCSLTIMSGICISAPCILCIYFESPEFFYCSYNKIIIDHFLCLWLYIHC